MLKEHIMHYIIYYFILCNKRFETAIFFYKLENSKTWRNHLQYILEFSQLLFTGWMDGWKELTFLRQGVEVNIIPQNSSMLFQSNFQSCGQVNSNSIS